MPKYFEAAEAAARSMENRTHDTEKEQRYEPNDKRPLSDSGFMDVTLDDRFDQGEAMKRGMQGGDAEIPRDEPVEGIKAKDPVAKTTDPTRRGHDINPRKG